MNYIRIAIFISKNHISTRLPTTKKGKFKQLKLNILKIHSHMKHFHLSQLKHRFRKVLSEFSCLLFIQHFTYCCFTYAATYSLGYTTPLIITASCLLCLVLTFRQNRHKKFLQCFALNNFSNLINKHTKYLFCARPHCVLYTNPSETKFYKKNS